MAAMTQMAASHADSMNLNLSLDLDNILRDIHASYTPEMCKNVVNFTNKNLKGEYKDFKSGEDLPDVLNTMKKQGQVGPSNTESLKYFVQNAKKENRKILMEKLHDFELKYRSSDNRDFVGRETDVDIVLSSIKESESNVINVFGEKGVGKTTFASKVAEKLNVPDKQIHSVDLQQAQDVTTIITSILLAFNHPKAAFDPRKEVVFEIVDNLEKLSVVILDNFSLNESKDPQREQREFFNILEGATKHDKGSNLIILITSHSELQADFVKNHRLEALSSTNSAELLKEACNDESTVDEIIQLCKNTPLHLQTTSAVLREKLIQPHEVLVSKSKHDISNLLIQAFDVFTPDMKKVAITLSLFQTPFTAKLAAMLLKCSSKEVNFYLGNLKFRHFLSLVNKKYSMHSLAKEVLAKKVKDKNHVDTYNEAEEMFSRLFVKRAKEISDLSDKDYVKMYLQLQKEKHNLNLAFKISFEKGFLLTSSEFSDNFHVAMVAKCLQTGHERAELFRDLSAAALIKGELVSYIHLSSELILVLLEKTSTKPEARELLKQIEATLQEAPRDSSKAYLLAESSYEFAKGEIAYADFHNKISSREEFDEGIKCHIKCLQTRKELIGDHTETTRSLNAVGNCLMELQEHETALRYFTEAVEMRKRLSGEKEHIDSPTFMNQIGSVHEEIGKKLKNQSRKSKMPEKKELYYQAEDQFKQEVDKFKEALNMERRLHIYGNIRTATFYRNLSNAYSYLEEYKKSYIYAKKALRIRKKILGVDVNTVRSYYQIGVAYEWLDDSEKALKYYYKAYNMENKLPPGERSRVKLKIEGKIQSLLGDIEEAVEFDSRTDEEAMTSDDDDEDERPADEEGYYSEVSSSEFGSSDEELPDQQKEPKTDVSQSISNWLLKFKNDYGDEACSAKVEVEESGMIVNPSTPKLKTDDSEEDIEPNAEGDGPHFHEHEEMVEDDEDLESQVGECEDVEESKLIGSSGCIWDVKNTGVFLIFEPNTVATDIIVKCLVKGQNSNPLDPGETLVSRFVHLESKTLKVNKGFDVVIPHSGPIHTKGYEVVVKEFCEETSTWRELDGDMFINIQDVKDLTEEIHLSRERTGVFCVVSRLVTDTMSLESSRCTLTSSVFPNICVELREDTIKGHADITLKVHPLPTRLFKSSKICCGPVLELSMSNVPSDDILKPVKIQFPPPLVFHDCGPQTGELRVLYKELDDGSGEWGDITDGIILDVYENIVCMEVNHFSLFWPVWLKDFKNSENAFSNIKNLFSKFFGKSPVSAWFGVNPDSRVDDKAILNVGVMPSHLAPNKKSNSTEDLYDKEKVIVELDGGLKRYESKPELLNKPFTIRFDCQHTKERGMHVDVQENRCTCQFRGFERSEVFCEVPLILPDVEKLPPKDFFGISLEHDILRDTAIVYVVARCREVKTHLDKHNGLELDDILNETEGKEGNENEAIKYFYQKIAHKDYEEQVFDAIIKAQDFEGGVHVLNVLEEGRAMVNKPIDEVTINAVSPKTLEFCKDISMAINLIEKYEEIKTIKKEKQFHEIMKAWKDRSGSSANLHSLMKVMLKVNCRGGVDELLRRYEEILSGKDSSNVTGHEHHEGLCPTPNEQSSPEEQYPDSSTERAPDSNDSSLFYYSVCLFVAAASFLLYRYIRK